MILVSKVLFGSVALATLASSTFLPGFGEAARQVMATWQGPVTAEPRGAEPATPTSAAEVVIAAPHAPQHCPGRCEFWVLLAQVR